MLKEFGYYLDLFYTKERGMLFGTAQFKTVYDVFLGVQEALADALGKDPEEVKLTSSLSRDLGAESIDMLDIQFRLEKTFRIEIPRGDLIPDLEFATKPEFVEGRVFNAAGIVKLKQLMPLVDPAVIDLHPGVDDIINLYTVQVLVDYVTKKLGLK